MGKLQNNKANGILDAAVKGKYAVPAVCVVSLHFTGSICQRCPFLVNQSLDVPSNTSKKTLLSTTSKAP